MTILRNIDGVGPLVAYAPADAYSTGLSAVQSLSVQDAAGLISAPDEPEAPEQREQPPEQPPEEVEAPEDEESTPEDGGDTDAEAEEAQPSGDDEEQDDADDEPPIAMPGSWSKEEKAAWDALPRAQQQVWSERERARTAEINRRLQETAEERKAAQALRTEAEQDRAQYKAAIDDIAARATSFLASEFSDIKTQEDVRKMAREDPARYTEWDAAVKETQAYQQEAHRLAVEKQQDHHNKFLNYRQSETERFLEARPEFADPKQAPKLQSEVFEMLTEDYGVSRKDLKEMWDGAPVSFHNHRLQLIIADALAYRKAKSKVATKLKPSKPASPPPQKPGTPPAKGEVRNRVLDQADKELTRTGSRDAALRLLNGL